MQVFPPFIAKAYKQVIAMLSYEGFFILILISLLGPVIGLLFIIFYHMLEQKVYLLEMENRRVYLENELQKSEYMQLTQQIQPHFLFNALNSLLSLARLKRSDQLIPSFEHLILFLRYKYQTKRQLHPLYQEIDYTRHYLAIQQMRFGSRLQVQWVVDPILSNAVVPPYLLQTLVENAFKHGLELVEGQALLQIRLQTTEEDRSPFARLTVQDNGPGFSRNPFQQEAASLDSRSGVGLSNIQKRLALLFPQQASLEILLNHDSLQGGTVIVKWPLLYEEDVVKHERAASR